MCVCVVNTMYVRPLNENEDVKSSTREFKFLNKLGESKRHELMGLAVRGSFMTVKRSHNPMTTRRGGGEPAFFCGIAAVVVSVAVVFAGCSLMLKGI